MDENRSRERIRVVFNYGVFFMFSNWQLYQNRFSKNTCERIIQLAKLLPDSEAKVGDITSGGKVATEIRISKVRWISESMPDFKDLILDIKNMFWQVNKTFGLDINYLPDLQFTEYYGSVSGKYDWHIDTQFEEQSCYHRKISMVIQLSDPKDYEGGNLELQPFFYEPPDPVNLRQQGTAIFFPSITYHRVTPVTSGTRYSLVAWMQGPRWR